MTIPGQPVSLDRAYVTGKMPVTRRGRPVLDETGTPRLIHRPILTDRARRWRDDCQLLMQAACPSRFKPDEARIRVYWEFHLTRIIDGDNLIKLCSDALQRATGINDKFFNHCVRNVIVVKDAREARAEVIVDSDPACRCFLLDEGRDSPRR